MPTFLINRSANRIYRIDGVIPSTSLPNKENLCQAFEDHILYSSEELPSKADLRPQMPPIEYQASIGSCTANALAGAYEYLTKKHDGQNLYLSRLFIYYNSRYKETNNPYVADTGTTLTAAIEALEEYGVCLENIWPYDPNQVNTRPSDDSYQSARQHPITEALQVKIDLNEMKTCLAQGYPFVFGLKLYSSFDQAATTGVVPIPTPFETAQQQAKGHALLAVGYSDQSQSFIVRNSWSENWGEQGYCYIPYAYLTNPELAFDAWTVKKVATDDFGQDHWDTNDSIDYRQVAAAANPMAQSGDGATIEELEEGIY